MPERARIIAANPANSLRTTVPIRMARQLNLGPGDFPERYLAAKGGVMIIEVTPAGQEASRAASPIAG